MRKQKVVTEIDIVNGLKAGDSQILAHLFDLYYTPLVRFAEKLIDDRAEAEDIFLNILQKFWQMRANFESAINIKAFLYISVRNQCLNYLKHKQRLRVRTAGLKLHLESTGQVEDFERAIIASEFMHLVYIKIQDLPPRCREIFELTYFDGLKTGEIAQKLKISVSNVTSQRAKALRFLQEKFGDDPYFAAYIWPLLIWSKDFLN